MSGVFSDAIVGDLPKKKVDTSLSIVRQATTRMYSILAYNGKMEHTEEVLSMNVHKQEHIYRAEKPRQTGSNEAEFWYRSQPVHDPIVKEWTRSHINPRQCLSPQPSTDLLFPKCDFYLFAVALLDQKLLIRIATFKIL